ncbi:MAG: prepilin peptidase [Streptosporangiaceae bacterium]
MSLIWAASGAVVGLAAGSSLRAPVSTLSVLSGEPQQLGCRNCGAPMPALVAIRCPACGHWFGPTAAIEVLTAAVLALLASRFGATPDLAAFAYLGVLGVALALIDADVQRLPDPLTLPGYPAMIALLTAAALAGGGATTLGRALLAGLALAAVYLALGILSRGQLGGGDIKLAGLIGLALGWVGWRAVVVGACLGFVLAAAGSLKLLATRRISVRSMVSFGPYMLAGALLAVLMY